MSFYLLSLSALPLLRFAVAVTVGNTTTPAGCRAIPGDISWPSRADWNSLNRTVGGKLVATIPIAAPCHNTLFGQPNPLFNQDECDTLRSVWFFPETHEPSSSSPMAYIHSNNSCNPFLTPDTPCTLGNHVTYAINATSTTDFQTGIKFARDHNVRLVIRNTGHDYIGKSTGAHSLSIWTHYLKSMDLISEYQSASYTGPAIKVGAGVASVEAYAFADSYGLMVVGGNCGTVGLAGGYTQGGGHGPLVSKFGLAADQVLEIEVVTANGELLTASATSNTDLFWALRGGGGSTFGIVASMTVKAYPDIAASTAYLTVPINDTNINDTYSAIGTFIQTLPALADAGGYVAWQVVPQAFVVTPAFMPGMQAEELDNLLQPVLDKLDNASLAYEYTSSTNTTYLRTFNSVSTICNVSDFFGGSKFVPRSVALDNTDGVVDVVRAIGSQSIFIGVALNVKDGVASPDDNAVNPAFRDALFQVSVGATIDYQDFANNAAAQHDVTFDLLAKVAALAPDGGAYLNEGDADQPDFQATFYGDHYARLLDIKRRYDPHDIFYAQTAVGSERWEQEADGRLCMVCNGIQGIC
ncbi:FAD/FMN-containing isoamyl alcohol oxidase MreA [Xylariaceae sp. FL1651]|nr:FAD/FMN-containing isoamyl alcohol oxidase MreA [Xylariaceae sp. FL1651]